MQKYDIFKKHVFYMISLIELYKILHMVKYAVQNLKNMAEVYITSSK